MNQEIINNAKSTSENKCEVLKQSDRLQIELLDSSESRSYFDSYTNKKEDSKKIRKRDRSEAKEGTRYCKKKQRNNWIRDFFLEEAEVDNDLEEIDYEDDEYGSGIIETGLEERGYNARDIENHRRQTIFNNADEVKIVEFLRQKYAKSATHANTHFGEGGEEISEQINQQKNMPSVQDPNIWLVKCNRGEEKSTALLLMRKFLAYSNTDQPLQIKSVVCPENARGYVYVEAFKVAYVIKAIENVGSLKIGNYKLLMVPIKEMTDIMKVVSKVVELKNKQWVRLKKGVYKNDVAQIFHVDMAENRVDLKLLPRINYTKKRGVLQEKLTNAQDSNLKGNKVPRKIDRPKAKLFDCNAVRAFGGIIRKDRDFYTFEGNRYTNNGFLIKSFPISFILADGIKPSLHDLDMFKDDADDIDVSLQNNSLGLLTFSMGDNVQVCIGDLKNLIGKVIAIDVMDMITIQPKHEELKDPLDFKANELRKFFKTGDHVKVLTGRYEGETGLVIRVDTASVLFISDLTMHELEVLPKDLQICSDIATGLDSLGHFLWGDFVQINHETVGVIVRLEREIIQVLDMHGKVLFAKSASLAKRKMHPYSVALDANQNQIRRNDIVKVMMKGHDGRDYKVKHLYRNTVFLYNRMYTENGGIFVCKSRLTQLISAENSSKIFECFSMLSTAKSPMNLSKENIGAKHKEKGCGGTQRKEGRIVAIERYREIIGTNIMITKGPYKGAVGMVKEAIGQTVQIELYSNVQIISVYRDSIAIVEANSNSITNFSNPHKAIQQRAIRNLDRFANQLSRNECKQPMYSRTPFYGSETPAYNANRTPNAESMTSGNSAWETNREFDLLGTPKNPASCPSPSNSTKS